MRKLFKVGKPRALQGAAAAIVTAIPAFLRWLVVLMAHPSRDLASRTAPGPSTAPSVRCALARPELAFTTGC